MTRIDCTLISDGSSDVVLIHILLWLLKSRGVYPGRPIERYDPAVFKRAPKSLEGRIDHAIENFPCDLLFIHRDAEGEAIQIREGQVREALSRTSGRSKDAPVVIVIPVRMTESWLLFDEDCIRKAAGSPGGKAVLDLPRLKDCERIADPKATLHEALRAASESSGRRLSNFNVGVAIHRVAELVTDYSPLRSLSAFQRLEASLGEVLDRNGWGIGSAAENG